MMRMNALEVLTWLVVHVFIPFLFLMHEGYLEIHQDTFFGEVFIEPNPVTYAVIRDATGSSMI